MISGKEMERKNKIHEALLARTEGGNIPALRALPEGEEYFPSLQEELMEASGIGPYLQIWEERHFRMRYM